MKRWREKGDAHFLPCIVNSNPLQHCCLENLMDRGTCWATVHGVTKSWTRLKWLSTHTGNKRTCWGERIKGKKRLPANVNTIHVRHPTDSNKNGERERSKEEREKEGGKERRKAERERREKENKGTKDIHT